MRLHPFANALLVACLWDGSNSTHAQAPTGNEMSQHVPTTVAIPRLPAPSGPYGVGRIGYDWIDPGRPDRYSGAPQAHRELMVYVWYPASTNRADAK